MAKENTLDYYLKTAWQSVANTYNREAAKFGITQSSGYVLINIHKEGIAVSQIAALLGVRSTSLSRMLNSMEKQGLIYRKTDPADKRSVKVFLTDLGYEKKLIAKEVVKRFNEYLLEHFSVGERKKTIDFLQRIQKLAVQYNPEEKFEIKYG